MKYNKECKFESYKTYVIYTEEGIEKGIFFRNPLQRVSFDINIENKKQSVWKYIKDIQNSFRKFYEILLGNKAILDNLDEWSADDDWCGFKANILCFPIYFKRSYRKLSARSQSNDDNIKLIESYGYESEFNICLGNCEKEITKIKLKDGSITKINQNEHFKYTYLHIIKEIIDGEDN
jgi:hypothetical protein